MFFDLSTPQGLTHIHMTALMRCVRCAARLQHMVAHRACRDIAAEILHSALSMRSRLRTAPGGQNLNSVEADLVSRRVGKEKLFLVMFTVGDFPQ